MLGWRLTRSFALIGAGLAVFAICDSIYVYQIATDSYGEGSLNDLGWPVGMALLGAAALAAGQARTRVHASPALTLFPPVAFGSIALALEIYDHFSRVNLAAVVLASAALAGVIVRLGLTFAENLRILDRRSREALTDALTGLGTAAADRRPRASVLDRAGTPSASCSCSSTSTASRRTTTASATSPATRCCARLGEQPRATPGGAGTAYRLGGDEFCVLVPAGEDGRPTARDAPRRAHRDGRGLRDHRVVGCASLPDEADDADDALQLADERMYAHKSGGRRRPGARPATCSCGCSREREPDLRAHIADVAELADGVARRLGLTADELDAVRRAAELHDVGKIGDPRRDPRQARPARRRRVAVHAPAHASSASASCAPRPRSRRRGSSARATSAGTAAATPTASPATRSRSARASSPSATRSTR